MRIVRLLACRLTVSTTTRWPCWSCWPRRTHGSTRGVPICAVEVRGVGASVLGRAAPRLAAAFSACPVPFVLLLDDVHELRSPDCHDVLGLVIERGSLTGHNSLPPVVGSSHTCRGCGCRVMRWPSTPAIWRSTLPGAQQIFSQAQVSLTPEAAAEVTARTEGWPAGLYLAAQIAAEGGSSALTVSGDDRLRGRLSVPRVAGEPARRRAAVPAAHGSARSPLWSAVRCGPRNF